MIPTPFPNKLDYHSRMSSFMVCTTILFAGKKRKKRVKNRLRNKKNRRRKRSLPKSQKKKKTRKYRNRSRLGKNQ